MTAKKRWPNEAENARQDSIALAEQVQRQVLPMLDALEKGKTVTAFELSLRLARISNAAKDIKLRLLEAGPQKFLD
jgi:hypothetical protein